MIEWENIPCEIRNEKVKEYYDLLIKKKRSLYLKRLFDIIFSFLLLVLLSPIILIISIIIKIDSKGPVFFRQTRITQYGKQFKIFKFRTMVSNADKLGEQVTSNNDSRITRVGKLIRGLRLDEIPQVINVLLGDMSFVGTRPEVEVFVKNYTDEMKATLLLPAGITSRASIEYKDEAKILDNCNDVKETYIKVILPQKMVWNIRYLGEFNLIEDFKIMFKTVIAIIG